MSALFGSVPAMIMLTGMLVGAASAILGLFLVLRGASMLSDAISHSILFGIVVVWLLTGALSGPWQIAGAAATGLLTVMLTEALARTRLVRIDAAVGLVFPALFAAGVLLISLNARDLHLDADAVLLGQIAFVWIDTVTVAGVAVPRAVVVLAVVLALNAAFVAAFWKELRLATFDPGLAAALGFAPGLLFHGLLGLLSLTAVASFEAVGVVLFVAFVIVPPAAALLLTDRLGLALALAVAIAAGASVGGYALALLWDVSVGGMMALLTGVFFVAALVAGPRHGLVARALRRRRQAEDVACRTLVAHLFQHRGGPEAAEENTARALRQHLGWSDTRARRTILQALDRGLARREGGLLMPTAKGAAVARDAFGAAVDAGPAPPYDQGRTDQPDPP